MGVRLILPLSLIHPSMDKISKLHHNFKKLRNWNSHSEIKRVHISARFLKSRHFWTYVNDHAEGSIRNCECFFYTVPESVLAQYTAFYFTLFCFYPTIGDLLEIQNAVKKHCIRLLRFSSSI